MLDQKCLRRRNDQILNEKKKKLSVKIKIKAVKMCSCRGVSHGCWVNLSPFWNPNDASVQQWCLSPPLTAGASLLHQYSQNYSAKNKKKKKKMKNSLNVE